MATMKLSVLRAAGQVEVETRELPQPARDEVLVEVGC